MMQQMELAAKEEPPKIAKISAVFDRKLVPLIMERLEKDVRNNYFKSGADEMLKVLQTCNFTLFFCVL